MEDILNSVTRLLSEVVLPSLKAVHSGQTEQIESTRRVEHAIEELRLHLESQFGHLAAQLTACRAELAATQAILKSAGLGHTPATANNITLVH